MGRRSDSGNQWERLREQIIGLGDRSIRKSYYPQLRERLGELERLRQLLDRIHDMMVIFELPSGRIRDVNQSACTLLQYDRQGLLQMTLSKLCPDLARGIADAHEMSDHHDPSAKQALITSWITRDGRYVPVEVTVRIERRADGSQGIVVGREIGDRLKAEKILTESEAKYRALIEATGIGFVILDHHGRVADANGEYVRLSGHRRLDQIKGRSPQEWISQRHHQRWRDALAACQQSGTIHDFGFEFVSSGDRIIPVDMLATLMERQGQSVVLALCRDATERRRQKREREEMARRFQDAQRFESIGTLAGGIAHDFNNLLMGIQGRTSLLMFDENRPAKDLEHLRGIDVYIQSATKLTRQLLGLAKGGKYEVVPTDINELVRKTAFMFGRTKKEVLIHESYATGDATAAVDRGQMEQVLLNLFINAWQAMPAGGDLYLETCNMTLDARHVAPFGLKPGRFIRISVTDSGIGMDEKTRRRVFEPFFTTRSMARGTGLGLASAYGIVTNHGGMITVYSEPERGSTFNIYLPASVSQVVQEPLPATAIQRGSETLLLVDDEAMILKVGTEMLEHLGYRVLEANTGAKAIGIYSANLGQVDLVILDMIMPEMSGGAVFDRLREIDPTVKVLLSSGYALNGQAGEIIQRGCVGFIQKPFDLVTLSQKIRQFLTTR
jgi:two-component system cell cycle sensor histidine kinase/response regulator CckA